MSRKNYIPNIPETANKYPIGYPQVAQTVIQQAGICRNYFCFVKLKVTSVKIFNGFHIIKYNS
jgi:hypothetical protein